MIDTLPLHPKLVHLPIALAVLMPLFSGGVLLAWWRGWFRHRTWSLVAAAQALLVASSFVAMRTGEADEERVERVVAESALEAHEEAAEAFTWTAALVLLLCVVPLTTRRPQIALPAALASVVGTGIVLGLGFRVGEAGGALVYRHGAAAAWAATGDVLPVPASALRGDGDDDDR